MMTNYMQTLHKRDMKHRQTMKALTGMVKHTNGDRRVRTISIVDILPLFRNDEAAQYINGGTVSNSYRWRASTTACCVIRLRGRWYVRVATVSATGGTGFGHVIRWHKGDDRYRLVQSPTITAAMLRGHGFIEYVPPLTNEEEAVLNDWREEMGMGEDQR